MSTGSPWGTDPALLRVRHKVRALKQDEEGFASAALPGGVFGFTSAPGLSAMPLFARQNYGCFEIHKLENGREMLIGYMTPQHVEECERGAEGELALYPQPFGEAQWLVAVDLDRVAPARRTLSREDGNPFHLVTTRRGGQAESYAPSTNSRNARAAWESARLAG